MALADVEPGKAALLVDQPAYLARYLEGDSSSTGDYRQYGFRIRARFVNRRDVPVYLPRCYPQDQHPMYGVRYAGPDSLGGPLGSRTESAYDPIWACVGHDRPIVVPPGTVRTDVLEVSGPSSWTSYGLQRGGKEEGAFRLHYQASLCPDDAYSPGCRVPESERASAVFTARSEHPAH